MSYFISAFSLFHAWCQERDLREQLILCVRFCLRALFCLFWIYTVTDLDYGHFSCLFLRQWGCISTVVIQMDGGNPPESILLCICGEDSNATVYSCIDSGNLTTIHVYSDTWNDRALCVFVSCLDFNVLIILRG